MIKWIGGGCLLLAALICGFAYFGYKKMKTIAASGPNSSIAIHAPAARVFAFIGSADSLAEWRMTGARVSPPHRGMLVVGDSVFAEQRASANNRNAPMAWVVRTVRKDTLIAYEILDNRGGVMMTQRDSLAALGDSTMLVVSFTAPMIDSIRARGSSGGSTSSGALGVASTMITAGMKISADQELRTIKTHLESVVATPAATPPSSATKRP